MTFHIYTESHLLNYSKYYTVNSNMFQLNNSESAALYFDDNRIEPTCQMLYVFSEFKVDFTRPGALQAQLKISHLFCGGFPA